MHTKAFPYIGLLGLLWGTNLVVIRLGVGQFDPILYTGIRLLVSSLAFILVYALSRRRNIPTDKQLWLGATLLGTVSTAVPMTAIIFSLTLQSSGMTALLITTAPAFIAVAAHFYLPDEQLNGRKIVGILLALAGAGLVVLRGESGLPNVSQGNPLGYGLVIFGIALETIGVIYIRKRMQPFSAFDVTAVRLTVAALVVLPLALFWRGFDLSQVITSGWLSLIYAALVGAVSAQTLAFYITKRFGAVAFSLVGYTIPVIAGITGVLWLGETITRWMVLGMVLISGGVLLINGRRSLKLVPSS